MSWQEMMGTKTIGDDEDEGGWELLDDYDKKMYDVLTPKGEVVMCWPNAGKFNEVFNGGDESKFKSRKWEVGTIQARLCRNHPLGKGF